MISIIVLVRNRPELTRQTLSSLDKTLSDTTVEHEVIIVDNDSDQPTKRMLGLFPQFHHITSDKNLGVGAGKNLGIIEARGDYLYISDNDIYFYPGWLDTILKAHRLYPEFKLIGAFRHPFHGIQQTVYRNDLAIEQSDQQVGSSWFLSKQTWTDFGPLEENLEVGADDVKMCDKVTAAGHFVGSVTPHKVFHCGATNTDGRWSPGGESWSQSQEHLKSLPKGILIK
jgi:GT2 family glycosyltransferase